MERLKNKQIYYKNIFLLGSTLSAGNLIEYFSNHTENFVVYYFLPRWNKQKNFMRIYKNGKIVKEYSLFSPKNIIVQYPFFYCQYIKTIFALFKKDENLFVIGYHPVLLFLFPLIRLFRSFDIVFWIVDYFPKPTPFLKIYQTSMNFFHNKNKHNIYLTDRINRSMNNGKINKTIINKTVMWGVMPPRQYSSVLPKGPPYLFYHGVVKDEHGIDLLLILAKSDERINVKILGVCDEVLYKKYKKIIKRNNLSRRVYFPNKFFSLEALRKEAKNCFAAVALYKVSIDNYVFYADPGKIKVYAEFGLPVIVSKGLEIGAYIERFGAGEVVERNLSDLRDAVYRIKGNYGNYIEGLKKFNAYFNVETYYKKHFTFMEE